MERDDDAAPRLATIKKPKSKKHAAAKKKRQRSGSDSKTSAPHSDDPRERLAAFRASMFDVKQNEALSHTASANPEDAVLLAKWKAGKDGSAAKRRKTTAASGADDDDVMPRIAIKATAKRTSRSSSKGKPSTVKSAATATASKGVAAASAVQIPDTAQAEALTRKAPAATAAKRSSKTAPASEQQSSETVASERKPAKKQRSSTVRGDADAPATVSDVAAALVAVMSPIVKATPAAANTIVTQDQLAMLNDVLSLDDPLETALQAAKAQATATTRTATKTKIKTKAKTKGTATKEPAPKLEMAAPEVAGKLEAKAPTDASAKPEVTVTAKPEAAAKAKAKAKAKKKQRQRQHSVDLAAATAVAAPTQAEESVGVSPTKDAASTASVDAKAAGAPTTARPSKIRKAALPVAKAVAALPETQAADTATSQAAAFKAKKMKKALQRAKHAQQLAVAPTDTASPPPTEQPELSTPAPVAAPAPEPAPVSAPNDVASKPERPQTRQSKRTLLATATRAASTEPKTPTPLAATAQLPAKEKQVQSKRVRAAAETTETPAVLPEVSAKPPSKRQRAEKSLQERRAVAQAAAAANEPIATKRKQLEATENGVSSESDRDDDDSEQDEEPELAGLSPAADEDNDDDEEDDGAASDASATGASGASGYKQIFSSLIDEAARQQWELLEVGRLVKLFAGRWGHKKKKTARFLRRFCPELVNVDFLEGLGIALAPEHLVRIFERGSGTAVVFMNKLASAVENGDLTVRDDAFVQAVTKRAQRMATNHDVLEFLVPLLESLSTVRDVSQLLKHVCADWHVERTAALVQQLLLTAVFDDLDGNQDEILKDLPQLKGRLDFPSRLDQEDADENGNLIGLIANEGSDLGEDSDASDDDDAEDALGEIHSDDDELHASDEDGDDDDEPYEGETDSEEERAVRAVHRPKRRSRFILDEADEDSGREDEDAALETEDDEEDGGVASRNRADVVSSESSSESESDSDDETWRSKPKTAASTR